MILKTSGAVKLVKAPDGRVVGPHMVGDRVGKLVGEAQLIYNLGLLPEQITPLAHPRAPDPVRGPGRSAPRPRR
ncbi:hypothetical protein GCM10010390_73450 [Streptomyces mordarskii]|uniref:Pyridine nucleotide-disulphide oxidoreductase dimerisation domain-containing protein n=1 Tax=Streptomyces mordarskii TaxID=1226758 RepID=A0ABP3P565_9ACTN